MRHFYYKFIKSVQKWTLGPYAFAIWNVFGFGFFLLDKAYGTGPGTTRPATAAPPPRAAVAPQRAAAAPQRAAVAPQRAAAAPQRAAAAPQRSSLRQQSTKNAN